MPIENTIAMLNLDMVGRANGSVDVSGLEVAPSMEADFTAAVKASGRSLKIKREGPGAGRSDDYNFIVHRIPAINFFTGFHNDYHRPGDDWQKIDAAGHEPGRQAGARVCRGARQPSGAAGVCVFAVASLGLRSVYEQTEPLLGTETEDRITNTPASADEARDPRRTPEVVPEAATGRDAGGTSTSDP